VPAGQGRIVRSGNSPVEAEGLAVRIGFMPIDHIPGKSLAAVLEAGSLGDGADGVVAPTEIGASKPVGGQALFRKEATSPQQLSELLIERQLRVVNVKGAVNGEFAVT